MIIVHMMGNLGNQLFIYAMARALQIKYNEKIIIDLKGLKRGYYSAEYKLDKFNLTQNIGYNLDEINIFLRFKYKLSSLVFHLVHYFFRYIKKKSILPINITTFFANKGFLYCTDRTYFQFPELTCKHKFLYGYFQSEKYFNSCKDVILNDLKVISKMSKYETELINKISQDNSVAISIRASKAFDNPKVNDNLILGVIDKDYYYHAMDEVIQRVKSPVFYVFADDIEIVKKEYKFPYPVIYVEPEDSVSGIRLMYSCKHFIISNSTFSWWGAYLGRYSNKLVVMPNTWDRFGPLRNDIFFGNPIKLDVKFLTE